MSRPASATARGRGPSATEKSASGRPTTAGTLAGTTSHGTTMRRAEIAQLETFVQERSKRLDAEISELREKLKNSGKLGGGRLLPSTSASADLNASILSRQQGPDGKLMVSGKGVNKVDLNSHQMLYQSKMAGAALSHEADTLRRKAISDKEDHSNDATTHMSTFLATLKLRAEDTGFSAYELRELLLPSDLMQPGEYHLPLSEVTSVLQTDIPLPVTKMDQKLILDFYGNDRGLVDVRLLLMDAGIWHEDPRRDGTPERKSTSALGNRSGTSRSNSPTHHRDRYDNLSPSPTSSPVRALEDTSRQGNFQETTRDIFQQTNTTLADLHDLHQLVMDEREWDDLTGAGKALGNKAGQGGSNHGPLSTSNDLDLSLASFGGFRKLGDSASHSHRSNPSSPRVEKTTEIPSTARDKDSKDGDKYAASRSKLNNLLQGSSMGQDIDRLELLVAENRKLKEEIGAFDSEFFEELEDLKYRYAKLQEIVGEDPLAKSSLYGRNQLLDGAVAAAGGDSGKLPLNRLAWSVRNSMRAMDRATDDSPLVQGPRIAHAHTYAPGVHHKSLIPGSGVGMVGGSLSATRAEQERSRYRDLDDSLLGGKPAGVRSSDQHPYLQSSTKSGLVIEGGVHGIGSGLYSTHPLHAEEDGSGVHGSFANLCERRLAFELAHQPNAAQATNEFLSRVMDLAEKNKATSKDPTVLASSAFYISIDQLCGVIAATGLSLSSQEIEVLASGFASDGKGSIDAIEFCDMVRTLLYNLVGSHFFHATSSSSARLGGNAHSHRNYNGRNPPLGAMDNHDDDGESYGSSRRLSSKEKDHNTDKEDREYRRLIHDLCETIITYDKKAVLGTAQHLLQSMLKPFVEEDYQGSGLLSFLDFVGVLKDLGCMFSQHEYRVLAAPYVLAEDDHPAASAYPSSNLNHLSQFRDAKLTGALRGKAMTQSHFGDFLSEHGVSLKDKSGSRAVDFVTDTCRVEYPPFVQLLVEELETLLEAKGGLDLQSLNARRLPWVLKEMEFVDVLIAQLENMRATARRKVLITLQYALQNADAKQSGELDGFAMLTALLNCGFRLQRYHRVQLLKAAEEFGGALDYSRLILTLLQTAIDWTHHERDIVLKILRAMGVTVNDRRHWLAKVKKLLMSKATQSKLQVAARKKAGNTFSSSKAQQQLRTMQKSVRLHKEGETEEDLLQWSQSLSGEATGHKSNSNKALNPRHPASGFNLPPSDFTDMDNPSSSDRQRAGAVSEGMDALVFIAPSAFLHVLRDCDVNLTPEEEATLLDCLDTERIAKQQAQSFQPVHFGQRANTAKLLFHDQNSGGFTLPMVDFQSFLSFCSRHCGSWVDTQPTLQKTLYEAIATLHSPLQALQEFLILLASFDERSVGLISQRAFMICCHRSSLLANVTDHTLHQLTDVLAVDGAGEIDYKAFAIHLRGICSGIALQAQDASMSLLAQLLHQASDPASTLRPLRNWLIQHSDLQSLLLTTRELNALLREFSVVYRPEDLDLLLLEVGKEVDLNDLNTLTNKNNAASSIGLTPDRRRDPRGNRAQYQIANADRTAHVVDTKQLMSLLMTRRASWILRNPRLARHLLLSLKRIYVQRHSGAGMTSAKSLSSLEGKLTLDGTEIAALDEVMGRIRAFTSEDYAASGGGDVYNRAFHTSSDQNNPQKNTVSATASKIVHDSVLIDIDLFHYIVSNLGLELSKDDLAFLADASDPFPEARQINPELLYEIMNIQDAIDAQQKQQREQDGDDDHYPNEADPHLFDGIRSQSDQLSDAALYALDHLQQLVRRTQQQAGRSDEAWGADLRCLFSGFDPHHQGFIAFADFQLGLSLLNIKMSLELLKDIPFIGKNQGYVQYTKIVDYVLRANPIGLQPSTKKKTLVAGSEEDMLQQLSAQESAQSKEKAHKLTVQQKLKDQQTHKSAVAMLLRVVRKKICAFIVTEANVEEAWLEMLRVFQRFDVTERHVVSPRDFCLAVSVLLDSDEVVLSRDEWEEVIEYFAVKPEAPSAAASATKNKRTQASRQPKVEVVVDYMLFCEMVLDPAEVQKKIQDVKYGLMSGGTGAAGAHRQSTQQQLGKMDRAKQQLSTSAASKQRMDSVDRDRMQAGRSSTLSSGRPGSAMSSGGKGESIERRFEQASERYSESMKRGREYGSGGSSSSGLPSQPPPANAASSRGLGSVDSVNSYRVAKTQGQSSRDHASKMRAPKSATTTVPSNQIYLAGKAATGSTRGGGQRMNSTS